MAKSCIITSDVDLWAGNSLTGANFSTFLKKIKSKTIRGKHMFCIFGTEKWCWKALVFRRFLSDFCAVPNLYVSTMCISLVWNWLVAAWICHPELQWLGFREISAYFCWCCTVPTHPFKCDLGLEMMWFDVSRSLGTGISFWGKIKTISTP